MSDITKPLSANANPDKKDAAKDALHSRIQSAQKKAASAK
jgi:hypothetical protein